MPDRQLDGLLKRMPEIAEAVGRFESDAIQARVLEALLSAYSSETPARNGSGTADTSPPEAAGSGDGPPVDASEAPSEVKKASYKKPGSRSPKSKQSFTIDKDLDLVRGASQSLKDFSDSKSPSTVLEKVLVSVYWLTRVREGGTASIDQLYTCFKHMSWALPSDFVNTVQQAGTEGWLDSKKCDDLKVVVSGENHVEHSMPVKKG